MTNRHGLSRNIPEGVKREVRQRCGFGCVICGNGIYQYDHFSPEFTQAREHSPDGITLLCGSHHDQKNHGLLSNSQIAEYDSRPYCKKAGAAFGEFHLTGGQPVVRLGNSKFEFCDVIIQIAGEDTIWIVGSDEPGEGLKVSARIRDRNGNLILEIFENEWRVGADIWDINTSGNKLQIQSKSRQYDVVLSFNPPDTLVLERAHMSHRGVEIKIDSSGRIVSGEFEVNACSVVFCRVGIKFYIDGRIAIGCS